MAPEQVLWLTGAISTIYLRATAFFFVRMLPLGYRFLPRIIGSFAISLTSFLLLRRVRSRLNTHNSSRTLSGVIPILFGTYSRRNSLANFSGLFLNTLALLACMDFIYRAHILHPLESLSFSRTGYVDSTSAKIVLRAPAMQNPMRFTYTESTRLETKVVDVPPPTEDSDFITTVELTGLAPGTRYSYNTSGAHAGSFVTSSESLKKFMIIGTSCQKPFYPYSPFAHSLAIPGLSHLARHVESTEPEFILFLGDFIYSDLPVQIQSLTTKFYRQLYRQIYGSPSWTRTLRDIPWIHVFDDHEVINDYYPEMADGEVMYTHAMDPFQHYQRAANPPRLDKDTGKTYTQFRPDGGRGPRTMLGADQLAELLRWISTEQGWKVIVSGVPVTRNWSEGGDEMDSWAGYLDEREVILQALWRVGGGVIISGDRHEHATVKFRPPPGYPESHTVVEFSTSPLSFFYQPFLREYVAHDETIFNLPQGLSKFGQFLFDSSEEARWKIAFELVVNGEKAWNYEHVWKRI
ncbi:PhoD-like phosphatase [Mycena galopus ATCC 62051]|nr:PhoD-like phosphatase [Mycena galopus ATCC 62051]